MKTYKCKTEIYVEVQAENESDALLKVGNYGTMELPPFYWEVEEDKLTEPTEPTEDMKIITPKQLKDIQLPAER